MKYIKYSSDEILLPPFKNRDAFDKYDFLRNYVFLGTGYVEEHFPCSCLMQTCNGKLIAFYKCAPHKLCERENVLHELSHVRAAWKHPDLALLPKFRFFMRK